MVSGRNMVTLDRDTHTPTHTPLQTYSVDPETSVSGTHTRTRMRPRTHMHPQYTTRVTRYISDGAQQDILVTRT